MENQFEEYEIQLIEKNIMRKPYSDIAFLLSRPLEEVSAFINDHIKDRGIITHQQTIDQKKAERTHTEKKPRAARPRKKKEKDTKIISRLILQDQKVARAKRFEPAFKTKKIDYSKMKTVRIDDKTIVYAEIHEDPEVVRKKYFSNKKVRPFLPTGSKNTEVKKFKPV
jgi:hypothetical protein